MPRFFDADSESETSEDESDDAKIEVSRPTAATAKFKRGVESSSDEEEEKSTKRVVKSQKDRRFEEMNSTIKEIRKHKAKGDWNSILNDFDKLTKQFQKASSIVDKEGVPRFYYKILADLEDYLKDSLQKLKEDKKKFTTNNAKALNAMKQKLKKNNKTFEKGIEEYKKNPSESEEESDVTQDEEEPEEVESEEDDVKPTGSNIYSNLSKAPEESESDEDVDQTQDSSEEDVDRTGDRATRWFLKDVKKPVEQPKKVKDKKKKKPSTEDGEEKKPSLEKKPPPADVVSEEVEQTKETIDKKLKEIVSFRGKKRYDRADQIEKLTQLVDKAKTPEQEIEILMNVVSAQFDITSIGAYMSILNWKSCHKSLLRILTILNTHKNIVLPDVDKEPTSSQTTDNMLSGNLLVFIERLDDEFIKSLQFIDPHTQDYVERLQDENTLLDLAERAEKYFTRIDHKKSACRAILRRLDHLYYKLDREDKKTVPIEDKSQNKENEPNKEPNTSEKLTEPEKKTFSLKKEEPKKTNKIKTSQDYTSIISHLASFIYAHGDERQHKKVMLYQIYHHAIHDRFYEARDLMLMGHLQDNLLHLDVPTQILFNRTMVQLGLCAFRKGLVTEAHNALVDFYTFYPGTKVKELLAQGVANTRFGEKNLEIEKQEKKRQVPYHMHINLDLLEFVHLISAMLLEIPNMAASAYDIKPKAISKSFRKVLESSETKVFTGPPESTRDYVVAAAKNLAIGEWKKCADLLLNLPIWNLMPNSEYVKSMLRRKIQEEGLRTYLFTYSAYYDSLSLESLSNMFELPHKAVHSLVSKMMFHEELHAAWDQPTDSIIMHKVQPSRLQSLALQLSEKVAGLAEYNERLVGGFSYKFDNLKLNKERWQQGYYNRQQRSTYRPQQSQHTDGSQSNAQRPSHYQQRQYRNQ